MPDPAAPIVVGVDGSFVALRAARWAGAFADRIGAPLHIVTGTPYAGHNPSETVAAARAAAMAAHFDWAEEVLRNTKDVVRGDRSALAVTTQSVNDPADMALVAASQTARMLVLGCDDVTATGAILVGSTTLATVADAQCPVVAWRGEPINPTEQPIVVGVRGPADDIALATGFEMAASLDVPLRAVHSLTRHREAVDREDWENQQWSQLNGQIDRWRERHPGVKVTLVCGPLKSSHALVQHSVDAQMVVVGNRRRNALVRGLFGSTSLNLLHHSKVPVVLCPLVD
ncbi:universal stress protein [soil metagenome]